MNVNVVAAQVPEEKKEGRRKLRKKGKMCIKTIDDHNNIIEKRKKKRKKPFPNPSITETGESSSKSKKSNKHPTPPSYFICEICVESKSTANESFTIKGCNHSYCTDCVTKYVSSKLRENVSRIGCPVPGCGGYLDPEHCRPILPPEVFDRWGNALCEAAIDGSHKFYCPFKDCSMMMLIDDDGKECVRKSECPNCRRLFCAKCKVAWHSGILCSEFRKLKKNEREKEDIMLMKLAHNKGWGRCPYCRFLVAKRNGCSHIKCRCGRLFNYRRRRVRLKRKLSSIIIKNHLLLFFLESSDW